MFFSYHSIVLHMYVALSQDLAMFICLDARVGPSGTRGFAIGSRVCHLWPNIPVYTAGNIMGQKPACAK